MNQKLEILEGLDSRGRLVKFEKHKPPGVKKSDDPNYDDDGKVVTSDIISVFWKNSYLIRRSIDLPLDNDCRSTKTKFELLD